MTVEHTREKLLREQYAVEYLLKCPGYESYSVLEYRDKPDVLLVSPQGQKLGIEVADIFQSDEEAIAVLGRATTSSEWIAASLEELLREVNDLIREKTEKVLAYQVDFPVSLLMRSASRLYFAEDFRDLVPFVRVPDNEFQEILLLFPRTEITVAPSFPGEAALKAKFGNKVPIECLCLDTRRTEVIFPEGAGDWTDIVKIQ